ncbi:CBO0543 family protein [Guptibacillus spartinae]|uniref:CBO0543 family protein n=1 Tax=Guptibacillus spartinae TaxID=3025679 RepID=UPI002360F41F|nr:CBO0543 family protein [Pseudalkalibacillus spartinae]
MMIEKTILWLLVLIGVGLFVFSMRKPPIKEWLLFFLLTGYFSSIIGVIVVEEGMLTYPVNLFNRHFDSSLTYEYVLFPVVGVYYYQSTFRSGWTGYFVKGFIYSGIITITEFFLEKYTDLIHYESWTWYYTFFSTILLLLIIRIIVNYLPGMEQER